MEDHIPKRRHLLLAGGGMAAWVAAFQMGPGLISRLSGPDYVPFDRVEGFRAIAGGEISRPAFDFTLGIGERDPVPTRVSAAVARDPPGALFPDALNGGNVAVAYFFDYYCPYCRTLSGYLDEVATAMPARVVLHHWPIFGAASDLAARAALAAAEMGAGEAMHARLMHMGVRVTPPVIEATAGDLGLSWADLFERMQGAEVTMSLDRSRALARLFGFPGTPALVVGRTVLEGEVGRERLRRVIEDERRDG